MVLHCWLADWNFMLSFCVSYVSMKCTESIIKEVQRMMLVIACLLPLQQNVMCFLSSVNYTYLRKSGLLLFFFFSFKCFFCWIRSCIIIKTYMYPSPIVLRVTFWFEYSKNMIWLPMPYAWRNPNCPFENNPLCPLRIGVQLITILLDTSHTSSLI